MKLSTIEKGFGAVVNSILIFGLIIVVFIVLMEAILRYGPFSMPLGIQEAALLVVAWFYYLAFGMASRDKAQITVNILTMFPIPSRILRDLDIMADLVSFVIFTIFTYFAIIYCIEVGMAHKLLAPFRVTVLVRTPGLALGLAVGSFYSLAHLIRQGRRMM